MSSHLPTCKLLFNLQNLIWWIPLFSVIFQCHLHLPLPHKLGSLPVLRASSR